MPVSRLVLVLAASLPLAGPAFAHAHLTSALPPAGGSVAAAPDALTLTFSEGLSLAFSGVALTKPDGTAVPTGPARFGPAGDTVLVVPVGAPLAPGRYTVTWHALSTDGHKTNGVYPFTIRP